MLRFLTAGESHGQALVAVVEGLPAGLEITVEEIQAEMARRRLGYGRGPRQKFEQDELTLIGGVRHGRTLGSPVVIEIKNSEWFRSDKWHEEMSPAPGETKDPLTQVRPGHADLAGMQKYGFTDARDVLERASARETAARVAAGSLAKKLLSHLGVEIISHVIQMGDARVARGTAHARRPGRRRRIRSPVLRPRRHRADGRSDQGGSQAGRLARGHRRSARLRCAGRARLTRALGPQARRDARSGTHVDPGGQGRRDRRRFRGGGSARQRGPRRDPMGLRERALRPPEHTGGRTRGRHDQWRARGGQGSDEATRHAQPPHARNRRHRDQGVGCVVQGADRRDGRSGDGRGGRDDGGVDAREEAQRKFGGDSVDEFVRNAEAFQRSL